MQHPPPLFRRLPAAACREQWTFDREFSQSDFEGETNISINCENYKSRCCIRMSWMMILSTVTARRQTAVLTVWCAGKVNRECNCVSPCKRSADRLLHISEWERWREKVKILGSKTLAFSITLYSLICLRLILIIALQEITLINCSGVDTWTWQVHNWLASLTYVCTTHHLQLDRWQLLCMDDFPLGNK